MGARIPCLPQQCLTMSLMPLKSLYAEFDATRDLDGEFDEVDPLGDDEATSEEDAAVGDKRGRKNYTTFSN